MKLHFAETQVFLLSCICYCKYFPGGLMSASIFLDTNEPSGTSALPNNDIPALTQSLQLYLSAKGVEVLTIRNQSLNIATPSQTAAIANSKQVALYLSICSCSLCPCSTCGCVEALVYRHGNRAAAIAHQLTNKISSLGLYNLGIRECPNHTILRRTNMPAIRLCIALPSVNPSPRVHSCLHRNIASLIGQELIPFLESSIGFSSDSSKQFFP